MMAGRSWKKESGEAQEIRRNLTSLGEAESNLLPTHFTSLSSLILASLLSDLFILLQISAFDSRLATGKSYESHFILF